MRVDDFIEELVGCHKRTLAWNYHKKQLGLQKVLD